MDGLKKKTFHPLFFRKNFRIRISKFANGNTAFGNSISSIRHSEIPYYRLESAIFLGELNRRRPPKSRAKPIAPPKPPGTKPKIPAVGDESRSASLNSFLGLGSLPR